jgi:hypothetical protein
MKRTHSISAIFQMIPCAWRLGSWDGSDMRFYRE